MTIEVRNLKNGRKSYVARVWDPQLARKVSKSFSRQRDAERAEADMKVRAYTGGRLERPKDILFSALAEEVLANCTASKETVKEYEYVNASLIALLGKKSMRQLTVGDIERAVADLSSHLAPNTVNKHVVRLRHICKRAVAYGYVTISPAEHISNKPKVTNVRKMGVLDDREVRAFLDTSDPYWRPMFVLWLATGLRFSEILGLDPSCVDAVNNRVHVRHQLRSGGIVPFTKNRTPRAMDVTPAAIEVGTYHIADAH